MLVGDVLDWLGVAQFLVGAIAATYGTLFGQRWPHRNLWRFRTDEPITICLATSARIDTGKYIRSTTGLGQVKALATIVPSILKGFGTKRNPQVVLSDDVRSDVLRSNLILLGGAKNNEYARRIFDEYSSDTGFNYVGDLNTVILDGESITGTTRDDKVVRDWAIIMRVPNPYSEGRTDVTLIAGIHTHGVEGAARYFVKHLVGWRSIFRKHFICVVELEVVESETVRPRLYKMKRIKK